MKGTKLFGAQFRILDQHNQKMHVDPEAYIEFEQDLGRREPGRRLRPVATCSFIPTTVPRAISHSTRGYRAERNLSFISAKLYARQRGDATAVRS